jgi:hypothetical protein
MELVNDLVSDPPDYLNSGGLEDAPDHDQGPDSQRGIAK